MTAALLLMANTVASPAIAQDTLKAASRSVGLVAFSGPGEYQLLRQVDAPAMSYPLPLPFRPARASSSPMSRSHRASEAPAPTTCILPTGTPKTPRVLDCSAIHYHPASVSLRISVVAGQTIGILAPPGAGPVYVYVHGYLTAD